MRGFASRAVVWAFALVLLGSVPAEAGLLSWLSKLSGPGPFLGLDASFALKCFPGKAQSELPAPIRAAIASEVRLITCPNVDPTKPYATLFFTAGAAWSLENDLDYGGGPAPTIGMLKTGMSIDVTVVPWLDLGAGGGFRYFAGGGFDNFALPYVQPVRVGVRPLLFAGVDWLMVTFNGEFLLGVVDGARFGSIDNFRESNEFLREWGISIDVPRILQRKNKDKDKKKKTTIVPRL